jgi:hypothetical protein
MIKGHSWDNPLLKTATQVPSAVLVLVCSYRAVVRTKMPRAVAGTTSTVYRRRGLGRQFPMRASSNLKFKNISEFGHTPSNNGDFRAHTRRFGFLYHFVALERARGVFPGG